LTHTSDQDINNVDNKCSETSESQSIIHRHKCNKHK
jgi:hypothetical protein